VVGVGTVSCVVIWRAGGIRNRKKEEKKKEGEKRKEEIHRIAVCFYLTRGAALPRWS